MQNFPIVSTLKHTLAHQAAHFFIRSQEVEGNLKDSNIPFRMFVFGQNDFTKNLLKRTYGTGFTVRREWRAFIPNLKKQIKTYCKSADLCVAVLPRESETDYSGLYDCKCPELVQQIIHTSGGWEDVRNGFVQKKQQITNNFAERYGLEYRISHEQSDLDFFYKRMFVPHVERRYGKLAIIDSFADMQRFFEQGMLLFVTKNGVDVAGALSLIQDRKLIFRRTGVLDGDETHVEAGAQTALYYFQLRYANGNGLHAVDTMMSNPYLNDGVFRHKKEWGAEVSPSNDYMTWAYFFHGTMNEKLATFYDKNPLTIQTEAGMKGLVGIPLEASISEKMIQDIKRRYNCRGLNGFVLFTPAGMQNVA